MSPLDNPVLRGAGAAIAIAAPAALIGQALTSLDVIGDESNWIILFFLVIVAAFLVAGWLAARTSSGSPLRDGAAAAFVAYAVIQGVALVRVLIAGESADLVRIVFNALLSASLGATGAIVSQRRTIRVEGR